MGEIVEGYSKPSIFQRLFCKRVFRPRYYKYFDSFADFYLPDLPQGYLGYKKIVEIEVNQSAVPSPAIIKSRKKRLPG